jgi:hypothetical protein
MAVGWVRRTMSQRSSRTRYYDHLLILTPLVGAFRSTGFRPGNSWYLNDEANIAYSHAAPDGGRLRQPALFINGAFDGLCDISHNRLGSPCAASARPLPLQDSCPTDQILKSFLWSHFSAEDIVGGSVVDICHHDRLKSICLAHFAFQDSLVC